MHSHEEETRRKRRISRGKARASETEGRKNEWDWLRNGGDWSDQGRTRSKLFVLVNRDSQIFCWISRDHKQDEKVWKKMYLFIWYAWVDTESRFLMRQQYDIASYIWTCLCKCSVWRWKAHLGNLYLCLICPQSDVQYIANSIEPGWT